jgi:hypothetical protein
VTEVADPGPGAQALELVSVIESLASSAVSARVAQARIGFVALRSDPVGCAPTFEYVVELDARSAVATRVGRALPDITVATRPSWSTLAHVVFALGNASTAVQTRILLARVKRIVAVFAAVIIRAYTPVLVESFIANTAVLARLAGTRVDWRVAILPGETVRTFA